MPATTKPWTRRKIPPRPAGIDEEDSRWRAQLDGLNDAVYAWTGNHAGVIELAEADLEQLRRDPPAILGDLRADGIDLAGVAVRALLKEHR